MQKVKNKKTPSVKDGLEKTIARRAAIKTGAEKLSGGDFKTFVLKAPLKFAALSFVASIIIALLISLYFSVFGDNVFGGALAVALIGVTIAFVIKKALNWMPAVSLGRNDFLKVNITTGVIKFAILGLMVGLLVPSEYYWLVLAQKSQILFIVLVALFAFVMMYLLGTMIANANALYKRMRTMGMSKGKALFAFPFSYFVYWIAGFAMPEKEKPVGKIFGAILKNGLTMTLFVLLVAAISLLFADISNAILVLVSGLIFVAFRMFKTDNVKGKFGTFGVLFNVLILVGVILVGMYKGHEIAKNQIIEVSEDMEVSDTGDFTLEGDAEIERVTVE